MKISGVYKITNTITGDYYIGSSKNIKQRWAEHKCQSVWKRHPNNPLYLDFQKYGIDKFSFQILEEVEIEQLKKVEQQFIQILKPTYNQMNAKGLDAERLKKYQKQYHKEYEKTDKCKEYRKKYKKQYENQLCLYEGETITLGVLRKRFWKKGITNPVIEAKKYLIRSSDD